MPMTNTKNNRQANKDFICLLFDNICYAVANIDVFIYSDIRCLFHVMKPTAIPIFKKAPFIRLLVPLAIGIIAQWYLSFSLTFIVLSFTCFTLAYAAFNFLPDILKYRMRATLGLPLSLIVLCLGLFITYAKDIRNNKEWFGNSYKNGDSLVVSIDEPLHIKSTSYKADAVVEAIMSNGSTKTCRGKILLYFTKNDVSGSLNYGDKILITKPVQRIRNLGNPAEFDYKEYSSFRQRYHTIRLGEDGWIPLHENTGSAFRRFIISTRQRILNALRNNIEGRNELAIAEAMLVGYRDDLDTDIVMAYANTGVIHVIIIAGLHLGIIYFFLSWLLNGIRFLKRAKVVRLTILLCAIWLFVLVTGAGIPVLRAAVMISCFIVGDMLNRRRNPYNSIAASAFILLCIDPFYLWDAGFQLSYLAVIGINIFQRPIYNLLYFQNKLFDKIWTLISVSISAQLLLFPVCLYYFHQFPLFFITTNIIIVPLMALILYLEILMVLTYPVQVLAFNFGRIVELLIGVMNKLIVYTSNLPFAIWNYIPATLFSTILLYGVVLGLSYWLMNKSKTAFKMSLVFLSCFVLVMGYTKIISMKQHKLIVYNIPQHSAIDLIKGNDYTFFGDSVFAPSSVMENYYLKPSRTSFRASNNVPQPPLLPPDMDLLGLSNNKVLLLNNLRTFQVSGGKADYDVIVLYENASVNIPQLDSVFNCKQYILDASNSVWKIEQWKKECERLHLPFHSVPEQGAFVKDL
jgi:competence protein ComEC